MDLTKNSPRSVGEKSFGIVQLARTIDKANATANGTAGEYDYDCRMDRNLFEFLGTSGSAFLDVVKNSENEWDIEAYVQGLISKIAPRELEAFNRHTLQQIPRGESWNQFAELRTRIAPERTDVSTWPDLLDLDEGRTVPVRVAAKK
ncbi:MAG: DUF5069 domain-containing protein [Candidatus Baltobacteraceae bacterium]